MTKPGLQRGFQSSSQETTLKSIKGKAVIGIDLGTTKCCVAYATTPKGRNRLVTHVYKGWAGGREQGIQSPITALYYESGRRPKTGTALDKYLKSPKEIYADRYFHLWKWLFHNDQGDPSVIRVQKDSGRKLEDLGKTREDLMRDWVEATYRELFQQNVDGDVIQPVRLKLPNDDRELSVEIVIAVPPGRDGIVHEEVLRCFLQFGITENQVCLVSEPEAMFRSWVAAGEDTIYWKVGRRYLVADGGGGTTCLVRYKLVELRPKLAFEQEFKSQSLLSAAESISNSFVELARKKIPAGLSRQRTDYYLHCLRRDFDDQVKLCFGDNDNETGGYCLRAPWKNDEIIKFSYGEIAECFEQCVSRLVEGLHVQCGQGEPVDYLVLGGGLFSNRYVINAIRKSFPSLEVRDLSQEKSQVASGCVLTRFDSGPDGFIVRRPILQSKGLATWMEVTSSIRSSPLYDYLILEKGPYDKKEYFWAVQWLAKGADGLQLFHAGNRYEVNSESTFSTARKRQFWINGDNPQYTETILTVSCHPGNGAWSACRIGDESLLDQNGNLIPGKPYEEKLEWNPRSLGIREENLETKESASKRPYKVIRYSISMEMKEVGTKYMIKAWSLEGGNAKDPKKRTTVYSEPEERQFSYGHQISQNLLKSLELEDQFRGDAIQVGNTTVGFQNHSRHDSITFAPTEATSTAATQESQEESSDNIPVVLHEPIASLKRSASSQGFLSPSQAQLPRSALGVVNPSQQQVVEPNNDHTLDSRGAKARKIKSSESSTNQHLRFNDAPSTTLARTAPMLVQSFTSSTQQMQPNIEDDLYGASSATKSPYPQQ